MGNEIAYLDNGDDNTIDGNILPGGTGFQFPFETLLIILIVGIVAIGITGSVIIRKRIMSSREAVGKREISEQKKEKVRKKLEKKLNFVDFLIEENKFKLAYKNLGKIKDTSDQYDFFDIFNKANEKAQYCMDVEKGIITKKVVKEEGITSTTKRKVTERAKVIPLVKKEAEKGKIKEYRVFLSYSTKDSKYFQIPRIVKALEQFPEIEKVLYWEADAARNIVDYMEETLKESDLFVLFCSENSVKSSAVKDEWQAAFQMRKKGFIKLIPVYEKEEHVPVLLMPLLNVLFTKDDFGGFIKKLYEEILREGF